MIRILRAQRSFATALPKQLVAVPPLTETTLENGFRIASEDTGGATATVGIFLDAGSAFETSASNGAAHFLEHMAFKGTESRSRTDLEVQIENMGASLNAYTSREQTVFWSRCLSQDVPKVVEILADIVTSARLEDAAIETERGVILEEKENVEADPNEVLFDYLHAAAFQGSPLARTILGPEANIRSLSATELRHYTDAHYHPPRMALCAAGGVRHDDLVSAATTAFGAREGGPPAPKRQVPPFTGAEIRLRDDAMPEAHVAIAYESVGWRSPDFYTFQVLQALIGNWSRTSPVSQNSSTRLAEMVATERLAHSFSAFHTPYNEIGLFGIQIVADPNTLDDCVHGAITELVRLGADAGTKEVERAKNTVKAQLLLAQDGSQNNTEEIGRQLIAIGRRIPPAEMWARVDAITAADVQRIASQYCTDCSLAVAAMGPISNLPEANQLGSWTRPRLL